MFWSFSPFVSWSLQNFSTRVKFISFSRYNFLQNSISFIEFFHLLLYLYYSLLFFGFVCICKCIEFIKRPPWMDSISFAIFNCVFYTNSAFLQQSVGIFSVKFIFNECGANFLYILQADFHFIRIWNGYRMSIANEMENKLGIIVRWLGKAGVGEVQKNCSVIVFDELPSNWPQLRSCRKKV